MNEYSSMHQSDHLGLFLPLLMSEKLDTEDIFNSCSSDSHWVTRSGGHSKNISQKLFLSLCLNKEIFLRLALPATPIWETMKENGIFV